jgi:hypothetical protein
MSPRQRHIACYTLSIGIGLMLANALVLDTLSVVWTGIVGGLGGLLAGHGFGTLLMPRRPAGVTLRTDDAIIDLDKRLSYAGRDEAGIRHWRCPLTEHEITLAARGDGYVKIAMMPARSALDFGAEVTDDDERNDQ